MKKTLALILTVIMVLSIMPMAYAQRVTYSPEIEQYIEDYIRLGTYYNNQYKTYEQQTEVRNIISEAIDGKTEVYPYYEDLINIEADGRLEELTAFHEGLKKGIDEVEKKIADGEIAVVIDAYEFWKCYVLIQGHCYYSDEDVKKLEATVENSEKFINARTEAGISADVANIVGDGMYTGTQSDFDAAMEPIKYYCNSLFACLDGDHPYGEYISNNDATEEADGTKTATCEFCGATDTITDEGTKLVKEEEPKEEPEEEKVSFFEMLFALIKEFFAKIFSIFK